MELVQISRARQNKFIGNPNQEGDINASSVPTVPRDHNLLSLAAALLHMPLPSTAFSVNLAKLSRTNTGNSSVRRALSVPREK